MTDQIARLPDVPLEERRRRIEAEAGKTPEVLYDERERRVRDAIMNRTPDRVPLFILPEPVKYAGLGHAAEFYDPRSWKKAVQAETLYLQPDMALGGFGSSGRAWELLGVLNRLWPGGPLPPTYEYQFVEGEYMKEDEYDHFLSNPGDFIVRRLLPRVYSSLEPLADLPPLANMFFGFEHLTPMFTSPAFVRLAEVLRQAGAEVQRYRDENGDVYEEMALLGFPAFSTFGGAGGAPFDTLSSFLRGMEGSMIDMFRRPEKLLRACDLILEMRIASAVPADPSKRGNPKRVGLPLWRGDLCFMSDRQFERFYWPGLKKALQASVDLGFVPLPFFEAPYGERLARLRELPADSIIAFVDSRDVRLARKALRGHTCLITTAPGSVKYWTLQQTEEFYKTVIDDCADGGGLMLNVTFPDSATPEQKKAMLDSLKAYGRY